VPTIRPRPAATIPFSGSRPARIATIDRPRIVMASISGRPKARISGRAMRMKKLSTQAPSNPPNSDDTKAADRARAACPFFDRGKPSSTVACDAVDPGIPNSTEAKVSDVGTTAISPTISARPETGSIPNMKGSTSDSPAIPPSPGNTPTDSPRTTPITRNASCSGRRIIIHASPNAAKAVAIKSMGDPRSWEWLRAKVPPARQAEGADARPGQSSVTP
jgi:hypothetical protein